MTILVQVIEGLPPHELHPETWMPWLNCRDIDETGRLALHRHIRNRGGVTYGETLSVWVYLHAPKMAKHPNGNPAEVHAIKYEVGGTE